DAFFFKDQGEYERIAVLLNQRIQAQYCRESPITFDKATSLPICTVRQFKAAQHLLRLNYPGLMESAFNEKQQGFLSNLLQIIVCGRIVAPNEEACFILREIKHTIPDQEPFPLPKEKTLVGNELQKIRSVERNYPDYFK